MPTENEIKLVMSPPLLTRLRRHPLLKSLKQGRSSTHHLVSVYYDTPDHELFKRKLALRVRKIGARRIQTLKAQEPGVAGLVSRDEWERELDNDRPDLTQVEDPKVSEVIESIRARRRPLEPVFATDVTRTAWMLRLPDGSEVALALDKGEVKAEQGSEPICEAELELRSGQAESMFDLAAQLHGDIPFQLGNRSKSSRGYDMIGGHKPAASKAEPLLLKPQMTVETAFKAVARSCLGHLEANEACSLAGDDPEGVHQMRVAIRRLRSAFGIFRDVLPRQTASEFAAEFRWLAQTLAPARDWDVFREDTLGPLRRNLPDETGLAALDALAATEQSKARREARATIDSPRYTELKLRFGAWLVASDWGGTMPAGDAALLGDSAAEFADRVLRRRHRKLCRKGDDHRELSLPELHELRISAKKMRYATEFFRRFYPRKRVKEYLTAMSALQEVLGGINDAAVGRQRLSELAVGSDADAIHAAAIVSGWFAAQVEERRRRFAETWRNFTRRDKFWSQGTLAIG